MTLVAAGLVVAGQNEITRSAAEPS